MKFDHDLQQFIHEYEGLIFAWDEMPEDDYQTAVIELGKSYHENFDHIIDYIYSNLIEVFEDLSLDTIKDRLGKPIIEPDNERVIYLEQTLDNSHIFEFEYMNGSFEELIYFSMDG